MQQAFALKSAQLWKQYPREAIAFAVLALAAIAALAGAAWSTPTLDGLRGDSQTMKIAPPAPPPLLVRALPREDALSINASMPLDAGPNPGARPFSMAGADAAAQARAYECLTSAVYYEAGQESDGGQRAVAQVILNRSRHPAFPASVCGVVYQGSTRATGCQFTFTCDGSLARRPMTSAWARAAKVAAAALAGYVHKPVGWATHYHANYVVPYWASSLAKNAVVGAHIFYRWDGGWGRPPAFSQRYALAEPNVAALREAALIAEAKTDAVIETLEAIPGAEVLADGAIGLKAGDKVAIRFNLAARNAVEEAVKKDKPFIEKVGASDNLKWTLTGGMVEAEEKPLGKKPVGPAIVGSAAVSGGVAASIPATAAAAGATR